MSNIVTMVSSGNYDSTKNFLRKVVEAWKTKKLFEEYGARIVSELSAATPVRTGETASSWSYEIVQEESALILEIKNSHMGDDGKTPVAFLIQMGHGTRTGGYVPPNDFINPVIKPLFAELEDELLKVVGKA